MARTGKPAIYLCRMAAGSVSQAEWMARQRLPASVRSAADEAPDFPGSNLSSITHAAVDHWLEVNRDLEIAWVESPDRDCSDLRILAKRLRITETASMPKKVSQGWTSGDAELAAAAIRIRCDGKNALAISPS